MGCWFCNPYCGKCRPPDIKPRNCESCGTVNFDHELTDCAECGVELPAVAFPVPRFCNYVRQDCANPCGRADQHPASVMPCSVHTPVLTEQSRMSALP
jgi:hypothetical protein